MAQNVTGVSDLEISSEIKTPDLRIQVTRIPFDDFFHLKYVREGREVSEELEVEDTRRWFKEHMVKAASRELELKREEDTERALDETWNFGQSWITIPGELYQEPISPFPQYQPQI